MHEEFASPTLPLRAMMIDFNSYFASVEQQLDPKLRGRPVGVVPMLADSTCCIAASYEAKAYGVKTGTRVSDAKKMCPDIVFIEAQHHKYVKMHHQAIAIVNTVLPVDEVLSIDEMCCVLTPRWQDPAIAQDTARQIKRALIHGLGECMKTSIGIAPNRFLAKLASNMQKPDGLVTIQSSELPHVLYDLKLNDLHGVGKNMDLRIREYGIQTVEALCALNVSQLRTIWGGVGGEDLWCKLRGMTVKAAATNTRSLGHSHVLPPDDRNRVGARATLDRLTQKAAMRLRHGNFFATGMSLSVGFMVKIAGERLYFTDDERFMATDDTRDFLEALRVMWTRLPKKGVYAMAKPLKVGLVLHGLLPRQQTTLDLFAPQAQAQSASLCKAVDSLNQRFGKNAIYYGEAHNALDSAPMRIAFNRIPDLVVETL